MYCQEPIRIINFPHSKYTKSQFIKEILFHLLMITNRKIKEMLKSGGNSKNDKRKAR